MKPRIGSIFDTLFHRQSLVSGSMVLCIWIGTFYRGPEQRPSSLWHDCNIKLIEVCTTTRFDIVQIEKRGQDTNSLLSRIGRLQINVNKKGMKITRT
jgi:hypothetical protein